MALDNAKNFAKATVSTGYDTSATSIVLTTGHGAKMPTVPFNAVWWNSSDYPDPADDPDVEIVRVTNRSSDTLTVTRAQESTSASAKDAVGKTYKMIAGLTAKTVNSDIVVADAINIATAIDGATGKTTPVDGDTIPLIDSAASNVLKKVTWANIKATLKAYFDTIYLAIQPTTIELGHASDTTLARSSAGNVSIEGNVVYRANGTDVTVADGGTGRSSHTAYAVLCGGTTSSAAQQSIASVGTAGHVLTSNGASALPTFQAPSGGQTTTMRAYLASGQTTGSGTPTKVSLATESFDVGSNFNNSTYIFTAPATGYYLVTGQVAFPYVNNVERRAMIYKNGSSHSQVTADIASGSFNVQGTITVTDIISLAAGDTIELYMYCGSNVTVTAGATQTFMAIHRLS